MKTKRPFQVGERVVAYDGLYVLKGTVIEPPKFSADGRVYLELDDADPSENIVRRLFHPNQLRRLVKKQKPLTVEWEEDVGKHPVEEYGCLRGYISSDLKPLIGKRVVVTVREKKE